MDIVPFILKGKALYSTLTKDHQLNHHTYGSTEQFPQKETYTKIRTVFSFSRWGSAPAHEHLYVTIFHLHFISDDRDHEELGHA